MREWATPKPLVSHRVAERAYRQQQLVAAALVGVALLFAAATVLFIRAMVTQGGLGAIGRAQPPAQNQWLAGSNVSRLPGAAFVATAPQVGAIYACGTRFNGGGAFNVGSWMRPDGTFDLSAKPIVDGAVSWPSRFDVALQGDLRVFTGNGLPYHATGVYPISRTDDAYNFDRNPNSIREMPLTLTLPAVPAAAAQPSCLPLGPIGVLRTGAVFFNALDAAGRDAVAYEIQDGCFGHPGPSGAYHYHSLTPCIVDVNQRPGAHAPLVGYAFDGFGIYGPHGDAGAPLTTADLDECHGHTHPIEWDGRPAESYHYHATWSYPYTLGCFRGTPATGPFR